VTERFYLFKLQWIFFFTENQIFYLRNVPNNFKGKDHSKKVYIREEEFPMKLCKRELNELRFHIPRYQKKLLKSLKQKIKTTMLKRK